MGLKSLYATAIDYHSIALKISFFINTSTEEGRRNSSDSLLTDCCELVLVHPGLHQRAHPLHLHLILRLNKIETRRRSYRLCLEILLLDALID
jgi:hypothetical protein